MDQRMENRPPTVHLVIVLCQIHSQRDDDEHFGNFGRLDTNADVEPALRPTISFHAEELDEDEQDEHEDVEIVVDPAEQPVVHGCETKHQHEAENCEADLIRDTVDEVRVDCTECRAADHQNSEDGERDGKTEEEKIELSPDTSRMTHSTNAGYMNRPRDYNGEGGNREGYSVAFASSSSPSSSGGGSSAL